eukprot:gene35494-43025_t
MLGQFLKLRVSRTAAYRASPLAFRPTSGGPPSKFKVNETDLRLRDDVRMLGSVLGNAIKLNDPAVFEAVEKLRKLGREWRQSETASSAFDEMVSSVSKFDAKTLHGIARSFSNFLALLREILKASGSSYGLWPKEDSCAGTIQSLLQSGVTKDSISQAMADQKVEIVLTAHPTEVNRRTMLKKYNRIKNILWQLNVQNLSPYEAKTLNESLRSEIYSIWESDNLRRSKPSPVDEARSGLAVVENVLWEAVPSFLRKLDDVMKGELGANHGLSVDKSPIKLASWMGGDRDGNPNVTADITVKVSQMSRWVAATLYKADIAELRSLLSMRLCSQELKAVTTNQREPYREVLRKLEQRLQATIDWTEEYIVFNKPYRTPAHTGSEEFQPIISSHELKEPLLLLHRSLCEVGLSEVADQGLTDTIRRLNCFGVTLLPLDIRQESTRHTEVLDAITRHLGIGSYAQWDEDTRRTWLSSELASKRPLLSRNCDYASLGFSANVIETLETFKAAAKLHPESLGAYVISQCQQASDILAVTLLQKDAGLSPLMRVVPLFETLDDLQRAPATVEALFSIG